MIVRARLAASEVGHKFARLATMRDAGLPVPTLFCLPAAVYREAVRPLRPQIEQELAKADFAAPETVRACAERIHEMFIELPLSRSDGQPRESGEELILAAFDEAFGQEGLAAVRACVVGTEDSTNDPYAGMSDSFLYVTRDVLVQRVRQCWASGFNAESLLYRHVRGLDLLDVEVAVGIQEMALGERSFVLFTRDPRTGDRDTIVAAGYGIGEGVVQEKVGVDHFFLRGDGQVERRLADKPEKLGPGLVPLAVPEELRSAPVLTDREVRELAEIGQRIERLFGGPQDIEGTFTADGGLHLVQARPIAIDLDLRRQWSNANVTESFPGITTTLTYTFAQRFYRMIFYDLYRRLGVDARSLHGDEVQLERMIGLHHGRVYYQLDAWYALHSRLAVFPLFRASWEQMMGLEPSEPGPSPGPWRLAGPLAGVARRFAVHDATMREFEAWWESVMGARRGRDWSALDPLKRIQDFHEVWREAGVHWGVTLINDSALSTYADLAQRLLDRWAPDEQLNDLLCGDEGNRSVAIVLSMVRVAERVRACPGLLELLDQLPAREVWETVEQGEFGVGLRQAFHRHLHHYGDRGLQELKMEQPNLRRNPWELLELTAEYARGGLTADRLRQRERDIRDAAERRLEEALGPRSLRLRALRALLARLRRCVAYRENSRYCRSELFGLAKEVFHSLGRDLAAAGVLRDADDVVHLTQDELLGWFDGTGSSEDLQALADVRRAAFERPGAELPMRFTTLGPVRNTRPSGLADHVDGPLVGLGSSHGTVRGIARVVLDPRDPIEPGTILIARETDPGWLFLMLKAAGIIVERGTMLSHTAITGRTFGIPTIVALPFATTAIPDGALIEMDGASGRVTILEAS